MSHFTSQFSPPTPHVAQNPALYRTRRQGTSLAIPPAWFASLMVRACLSDVGQTPHNAGCLDSVTASNQSDEDEAWQKPLSFLTPEREYTPEKEYNLPGIRRSLIYYKVLLCLKDSDKSGYPRPDRTSTTAPRPFYSTAFAQL